MQLKIHNYMKNNISDYNADRWSEVRKHFTQNKWLISIDKNDNRLPLNALSNAEKLSLVDNLPTGFYKKFTR